MNHAALLKTLLHELKDGVIVCDPDAKIALFNQAAEDLFGRGQSLCKGNSLYNLCFRPPVDHALSLLQYQHGLKKPAEPPPYVQFLNASKNQENFFRCRVSILPPLTDTKNSFIIIFEDISAWYIPDNPLFMKIEEFRPPMTNLQAAIENLTSASADFNNVVPGTHDHATIDSNRPPQRMGENKSNPCSGWQAKNWHDGFKIMTVCAQAMHPDNRIFRAVGRVHFDAFKQFPAIHCAC